MVVGDWKSCLEAQAKRRAMMHAEASWPEKHVLLRQITPLMKRQCEMEACAIEETKFTANCARLLPKSPLNDCSAPRP